MLNMTQIHLLLQKIANGGNYKSLYQYFSSKSVDFSFQKEHLFKTDLHLRGNAPNI